MRPPIITTQQLAERCFGNNQKTGLVGLGASYMRLNSCTRKKAYPTNDLADKAIERMGVLGMHSYNCQFCNLVHIGHRKD